MAAPGTGPSRRARSRPAPASGATSPGPARSTADGDRRWTWAAVAATVLGAAVALFQLGSKGLTYDEAYTIGFVRTSLADTWWRIVNHELNQAPYYLLFSAWYELGESQAVMRLLSAAFAVATVPVLFALGRRLFDARTAALASVLLALHGLVVAWAQQIRSYTMVVFLVTVASYLLVRAVDEPESKRWALAYVVVAAAGVYAHFFVALVVGAHALSLLALRPAPRQLVRVGGVTVAALLLPVAAYVLTRTGDPLVFLAAPSPRELLLIAGDVAGGGLEQLVVLGGAAGLGAAAAWGALRRRPGAREAWAAVMPVLWLVVPVVAVLAVTYTVKPLLVARYMIVIAPALALVAARGVTAIGHRRAAALATVAVVAVSAHGVLNWYRSSDRQDWRDTTEAVLAEAEPGDVIVVAPAQARSAVEYYQRQLEGPDLPVLLPAADDPPVDGRLFEVEWDYPGALDWDPMPDYEVWRDRHFTPAEQRTTAPDIVVRRYEPRSPTAPAP